MAYEVGYVEYSELLQLSDTVNWFITYFTVHQHKKVISAD